MHNTNHHYHPSRLLNQSEKSVSVVLDTATDVVDTYMTNVVSSGAVNVYETLSENFVEINDVNGRTAIVNGVQYTVDKNKNIVSSKPLSQSDLLLLTEKVNKINQLKGITTNRSLIIASDSETTNTNSLTCITDDCCDSMMCIFEGLKEKIKPYDPFVNPCGYLSAEIDCRNKLIYSEYVGIDKDLKPIEGSGYVPCNDTWYSCIVRFADTTINDRLECSASLVMYLPMTKECGHCLPSIFRDTLSDTEYKEAMFTNPDSTSGVSINFSDPVKNELIKPSETFTIGNTEYTKMNLDDYGITVSRNGSVETDSEKTVQEKVNSYLLSNRKATPSTYTKSGWSFTKDAETGMVNSISDENNNTWYIKKNNDGAYTWNFSEKVRREAEAMKGYLPDTSTTIFPEKVVIPSVDPNTQIQPVDGSWIVGKIDSEDTPISNLSCPMYTIEDLKKHCVPPTPPTLENVPYAPYNPITNRCGWYEASTTFKYEIILDTTLSIDGVVILQDESIIGDDIYNEVNVPGYVPAPFYNPRIRRNPTDDSVGRLMGAVVVGGNTDRWQGKCDETLIFNHTDGTQSVITRNIVWDVFCMSSSQVYFSNHCGCKYMPPCAEAIGAIVEEIGRIIES